jgi:hypothetical protein
MSSKRQLVKAIKILSRRFIKFSKKYLTVIKKSINWLLRTLFITRRRRESANAGFVLPTVAMVALVVVLLTTAILFRSFDRSKNASNVRVNQAVLNAAAPSIERARAKLNTLFEDPTLPRGTPSDSALYDALKKDKYRLGDESRLKLAYDFNATSGIQSSTARLEDDETLKTAWKYAVDTDNNGLKDSYTLYGIYFRSPGRNASGDFNRQRSPLDARTPPMDNDIANQQCKNAAGFSTLVGNSSWYKLQSGNLGKSFFTYSVNVPITKSEYNSLTDKTGFEEYKGNKGFVALEFQQDRSRIPLPNNAVWYQNDLEVFTGSTQLLLNGRIHTNGNLLVGVGNSTGSITLRQVSSKSSCFYNQENAQITVGGNVGNGSLNQNSVKGVTTDLYQGFNKNINTDDISSTNKSTDSTGGSQIGFNDAAYNQRLAVMKTSALNLCTTCQSATTTSSLKTAVAAASYYPKDVKDNFADKVQDSDDITTAKNILSDEIQVYLQNRTRQIPFAEISDPTGAGATTGFVAFTTSIDPQQDWREPLDSTNKLRSTTITVNTSQFQATEPSKQKDEGVQTLLGDRIFVGNNLPAKWLKGTEYVGTEENQFITNNGSNVNWTRPTGSEAKQRWRNTQIQPITDLGAFDRSGFWEEKAAEAPRNELDSVGGVRIVTGAGIYVDGPGTSNLASGPYYGRGDYSFLPDPTPTGSTNISALSDAMPMSSLLEPSKKGDLLMRATAVYHYKIDSGNDQEPIACVSSYYDPTNQTTAKNKLNVDVGYGVDTTNGKSNNGIVYNYPGRATFATYQARLQRQANLKFPNGRLVNEPLKKALNKPSTGLQIADYSAIDTALCAISILNNETGFATSLTNKPPHGAIKEASFLDSREIKQASSTTSATNLANITTTYDLSLEQRQPLEVRVTDIDLGVLASTSIDSSTEYLLPYSGIIYATREDALPDESDRDSTTGNKTSNTDLLSPTDFKLDPTRRPNGIRLLNGATLARNNSNTYNAKEKGLILVSNLPAYVKGKFNLHRTSTSSTDEIEEFSEKEPATNFYERSTANTDFACRPGRTGCPTSSGDYWRPATIISDSMTLLSGDTSTTGFIDGFRNQGDYDLNNNRAIPVVPTKYDSYNNTYFSALDTVTRDITKNRLKNGFWENNFLTSTNWWQTTGANKNFPQTTLGSYTLNGITPIQRRVDSAPMYVMEMCRKDLVSDCLPDDWVVGFDINGNDNVDDTVGGIVEKDVKSNQLGQAIIAARTYAGLTNPAGVDNILTDSELSWSTQFKKGSDPSSTNKSIRERLGAGDTGDKLALVAADQRYPRRVAFARNANNLVVTSGTSTYQPLGIGCPLDITGSASQNNGCTYSSTQTEATHYGKKGDSTLWFRTTSFASSNPGAGPTYTNNQSLFYLPPIDADGNGSPDLDGQPLLVPVLQIHDANNSSSIRTDGATQSQFLDRWIKQADANTTFNATFVVGNSPSRGTEISAGLQNLVRFLENWARPNPTPDIAAKISGSFIQLKRSTYATAPLAHIFSARTATSASATATNNLSLFDYVLDDYPSTNNPALPFYSPPTRQWGFDVGLLSEQPDLFAQRFTLPPTGRPNEFFREVGRDDPWVKTLLCAREASNRTGIPATGTTVNYNQPAVPSEYAQGCPSSIPSDSAS